MAIEKLGPFTDRRLVTPIARPVDALKSAAAGSARHFCHLSWTIFVISTRFSGSCSVRRDAVDVRDGDDAVVHLLRAFWPE